MKILLSSFFMVLGLSSFDLIAGENFPPNPSKTLAATIAAHNQAFAVLAPYAPKMTHRTTETFSGNMRKITYHYTHRDGELRDAVGDEQAFAAHGHYKRHRSYLFEKTNIHAVGDGVLAGAVGSASGLGAKNALLGLKVAAVATTGLSLYRNWQYAPTPYFNYEIQQRNFFGPLGFIGNSIISNMTAAATAGAIVFAKERLTRNAVVRRGGGFFGPRTKDELDHEVDAHAAGEGVMIGALTRLYDQLTGNPWSLTGKYAAVAVATGLSIYRNATQPSTPYIDEQGFEQQNYFGPLRVLRESFLSLFCAGASYGGIWAAQDRWRG